MCKVALWSKVGILCLSNKTDIYICTLLGLEPQEDESVIAKTENGSFYMLAGNVKPYLFPLSSMTEEQRNEYESLCTKETSECTDLYGIIFTKDYYHDTVESIDYLYKNHIDIRGFIPKGIALDATGLNIY